MGAQIGIATNTSLCVPTMGGIALGGGVSFFATVLWDNCQEMDVREDLIAHFVLGPT